MFLPLSSLSIFSHKISDGSGASSILNFCPSNLLRGLNTFLSSGSLIFSLKFYALLKPSSVSKVMNAMQGRLSFCSFLLSVLRDSKIFLFIDIILDLALLAKIPFFYSNQKPLSFSHQMISKLSKPKVTLEILQLASSAFLSFGINSILLSISLVMKKRSCSISGIEFSLSQKCF